MHQRPFIIVVSCKSFTAGTTRVSTCAWQLQLMVIISCKRFEMCFLSKAAPPEASYAPSRPEVRSVDEAMSPEEEAMDLLDFVNLRVFGNTAFREEQRRVIETVLKVTRFSPVAVVLLVFLWISKRKVT